MRFEFFDGYFSNIAAMIVRLDKFELARLADELFHVVRAFIVQDVFLWDDHGSLNAIQQDEICAF